MPRRLGLVIVALALSTPSEARADLPPPCDAANVDDGDREAAKGLHRAAEAYFRDARYEDATRAWLDAYRYDCSAHRLLINIGNSYDRLGKPKRAVAAFEAYVERTHLEPPSDGETADPVWARLAALERQAANPPPPVRPQPPAPPPEASDATDSPLPWIVVGVGGAGALAGLALLTAGALEGRDADAACRPWGCTADAVEQGQRGVTLQQAGGTALVAGLAIAGAGALWWLSDGGDDPDDEVSLAVGATSIELRIRF